MSSDISGLSVILALTTRIGITWEAEANRYAELWGYQCVDSVYKTHECDELQTYARRLGNAAGVSSIETNSWTRRAAIKHRPAIDRLIWVLLLASTTGSLEGCRSANNDLRPTFVLGRVVMNLLILV